jgi:hypothetical protein
MCCTYTHTFDLSLPSSSKSSLSSSSSLHSFYSSEGYCSTLQRLLQLAPKPKQTHSAVPFHSLRAQTVLVTHYVHGLQLTEADPSHQDEEDLPPVKDCPSRCTNAANTNEDDSNSKPTMPWPPVAHETFVESTATQQQLCLEIASGSAAKHSPRVIHSGTTTILLPGSLRERGEFCLVDMALMERDASAGSATGRKASAKKFAWKVKNVDVHRLDRFRTQK